MLQKNEKVALEMWSSQDLPILEEPCQLKPWASNLDTPKGILDILKTQSFKFLRKNDLDRSGINMTDFDSMLSPYTPLDYVL